MISETHQIHNLTAKESSTPFFQFPGSSAEKGLDDVHSRQVDCWLEPLALLVRFHLKSACKSDNKRDKSKLKFLQSKCSPDPLQA
jgi:hypothetical protein